MVYDSLGRLMVNKEPNTGNNWRYVWDDTGRLVGTSDARGCGVNYHYDGLSRLIGEDYSPCLVSQPDYTAPNFVTGEGFEAFYRYDEYETNQVSPEPNFIDDAGFALGNLVSVSDRGSHTRFNYDSRNRVRRIARQIAKPEALGNDSPYAPHWFTSRLDYDLGDRLTRRTTGADVEELLLSGASEERYAYSPRGQLSAIDSSYGAIVKSMTYDPDGATRRIVYGDRRSTIASFDYDNRHRLTRYKLGTPLNVFLSVVHFDYRFSAYDEVENPLMIEDQTAPNSLPSEAAPVKMRQMQYDDLYRLTQIDSTYGTPNGNAPWHSPFEPEISAGDRHPVPLRSLPTRVKQQTFDYDGLGNLTASSDDLSARYDWSLGGNLGYGTPTNGPNQLQSGEGLQVRYDAAGNLTELKLERAGNCPTGAADQCAQWFAYDWDEIGQLSRARRWDFDGNALPPQASPDDLPSEKPSWDVSYAYSQGARVRKSVADSADEARHTLEVFDTLRVEHAPFDSANEDYTIKPDAVHVYPGGMAHAFWDGDGTLPHQSSDSLITMHLVVGDHLGSSSVVLNHATSELVERTTYQPYGAVESDYRPSKWKAFRETYKFTGKEEDIEVGATYFGARYYQPYLGRFMSADPLTIQGLGSDLNPYAYVGGQVMSSVDPLGLQAEPDPNDPQFEYYEDGSYSYKTQEGSDTQYEFVGGPNNTASPAETNDDKSGVPGDKPAAQRDILSFERGNVSEKPSVGQRAVVLAKQGAIEGLKAVAWYTVDPLGVNRAFVKDILTVFDPQASASSRVAGGSFAVLSLIPVLGEARGLLGGAKTVLSTVARVAELRAAIPVAQRGRITLAVGLALDSKGVRRVLIGASEATSKGEAYLRPGVTLKAGETLVPGIGDAEENIVLYAQNNGLKLLEVGATRPICVVCAWLIDVAGAKAVTPLKTPRPSFNVP